MKTYTYGLQFMVYSKLYTFILEIRYKLVEMPGNGENSN